MGRLRATHPNVVVFTEVDIAGGKARSAPPGVLTAAWQAAGIQVAPPSPKGLRTRVLIQVKAWTSLGLPKGAAAGYIVTQLVGVASL